ncbi:MAG TPA: hypothetical protein DGT21_25335 [Armatimonadetes bacterium]|nr:hypothetical protein [Armatimonadota bacterium]
MLDVEAEDTRGADLIGGRTVGEDNAGFGGAVGGNREVVGLPLDWRRRVVEIDLAGREDVNGEGGGAEAEGEKEAEG